MFLSRERRQSYNLLFKKTFTDHIAFLAFCHLNMGNIVTRTLHIERNIDFSRMFIALCSLVQAYRSASKNDKTITRLSPELLIEVAAHVCDENALSLDEKRSILYKLKFQYAAQESAGPTIEEVNDDDLGIKFLLS